MSIGGKPECRGNAVGNWIYAWMKTNIHKQTKRAWGPTGAQHEKKTCDNCCCECGVA